MDLVTTDGVDQRKVDGKSKALDACGAPALGEDMGAPVIKLSEQLDLVAERLTQRTHKIDGHALERQAKAIGLERLNPMQSSTDQVVFYSRVLLREVGEPMDPTPLALGGVFWVVDRLVGMEPAGF